MDHITKFIDTYKSHQMKCIFRKENGSIKQLNLKWFKLIRNFMELHVVPGVKRNTFIALGIQIFLFFFFFLIYRVGYYWDEVEGTHLMATLLPSMMIGL